VADLRSVLSDLDPAMALQLQAGLASQLGADPARLAPSDVAGALAQIQGQFQRVKAADLAERINAMHQAAVPDLARLLAAPDPYQMAAAGAATLNPTALARLASASPLEAAQTKAANVETALNRLNLEGWRGLQGSAGGPMAAPGASPAAAPVSKRLPGPDTAASAGAPAAGAFGSGDYVPDPAAIPVDQRQAIYNRMSPRQRALFRMKLQMQQAPAPVPSTTTAAVPGPAGG
jgi:hypothetical protein